LAYEKLSDFQGILNKQMSLKAASNPS